MNHLTYLFDCLTCVGYGSNAEKFVDDYVEQPRLTVVPWQDCSEKKLEEIYAYWAEYYDDALAVAKAYKENARCLNMKDLYIAGEASTRTEASLFIGFAQKEEYGYDGDNYDDDSKERVKQELAQLDEPDGDDYDVFGKGGSHYDSKRNPTYKDHPWHWMWEQHPYIKDYFTAAGGSAYDHPGVSMKDILNP